MSEAFPALRAIVFDTTDARASTGCCRLDRSTDPEDALYVFTDPAGHPCCIFVSPDGPR